MRKKRIACLLIAIIVLMLAGCGKQNQAPQDNTPQDNTQQDVSQIQRQHYLTPLAEGTPLNTAAPELITQIMNQKDVRGAQTYEKADGVFYGEITLKDGVSKAYARDLAADFLDQLKVANPGKAITTIAVNEKEEVLETVSFTP